LLKAWKEEGVKGFYKGLSISLIGALITFGVYFFWYRVCKNIFLKYRGQHNTLDILLITALAGSITNFATSPFWKIETRMWVAKQSKSIFEHADDIIKEGGKKALWKGYIPGLILVLNPIINFVVYEKLKTKLELSSKGPLTSGAIFGISLVSKFMATITTYPMLTIKTKAFTDKTDKSTIELITSFIKTEGYQGLYRGLFTKLFQTLLYNAFMMTFFEKIRGSVSTFMGTKTT
jgi:adenine nucleotide transporter 17